MRGIPTNIATREDIYNIAMDLPPDQAKAFLEGLTPAKVKGLLNAEELIILKGRVAWTRWRDTARKERLEQKKAELKQARRRLNKLKTEQAHLLRQQQEAARQIPKLKKDIEALNSPMVDRTQALGAIISQEENRLTEMTRQLKSLVSQVRALTAKRADQKCRVLRCVEDLTNHQRALADGHDAATLKQILSAEGKLRGFLMQQGRANKNLVNASALESETVALIGLLEKQIGDLTNG